MIALRRCSNSLARRALRAGFGGNSRRAGGLRLISAPARPAAGVGRGGGSVWGLLGQDWFLRFLCSAEAPLAAILPSGLRACSHPAVAEDARSRGRLGFVLVTLPHVLARAIASFLPFSPFCWGMSAYRRTVRGIASRARQSCCQYEQDTIVGTQWQALASVHTRYSSKLLYSGTWLAAADGLIMAPPATVLRICV